MGAVVPGVPYPPVRVERPPSARFGWSLDLPIGGNLRLPEPAKRPLQAPAMSAFRRPFHEPMRLGAVVSRLLLVAILALHGLASAAEAAVPTVFNRAVAALDASMRVMPTPRDHEDAHGSASAARGPRPDAPRLGGGDCCNAPWCRCGCLYSVAGVAIAMLGDRLVNA